MDKLDCYQTEHGLEYRDGFGQLHNPNGPALTLENTDEYYEHGIWQKTVYKNGLVKFEVPTSTPIFEDHYGTRHYFRNNKHHGNPSIETLSGTKYYHYMGVLKAQLMPDDTLYYGFDDKNIAMLKTDKTGAVWEKIHGEWQEQNRFLSGARVSIKASPKYISEEWLDPLGSRYTFRNGNLYEQSCADGTVYKFPYENVHDRMIYYATSVVKDTPFEVSDESGLWKWLNRRNTRITTADAVITTECSKIINTEPLDSNQVPNHSVLDQVKQYIPIDPINQQGWFDHMKPAFEEYQRNYKIQSIIDGKVNDKDFLQTASKIDLESYQKALVIDFYNSFHRALRVGQALRLFKLDHRRLDSFANEVGKTKAALMLYCCQTLFENNPDHIKLVCEVNWL